MPPKKSFFPHIYPYTRKSPRAFSLVELLIALSIFAVVSIAIFSTFSSGLSVLRRVKNVDLAQQSLALKLERFSRELRQAVPLRKLTLTGKSDTLSFGQILDDIPCRVTYYFDRSARALVRQSDLLADIIKDGQIDPELKAEGRPFIKNVTGVKFSYLAFDLKKQACVWSDACKGVTIPLAIKLELSTDKKNYVQTVFLPTAQLPVEQPAK